MVNLEDPDPHRVFKLLTVSLPLLKGVSARPVVLLPHHLPDPLRFGVVESALLLPKDHCSLHLRLGASPEEEPRLVDCISLAMVLVGLVIQELAPGIEHSCLQLIAFNHH